MKYFRCLEKEKRGLCNMFSLLFSGRGCSFLTVAHQGQEPESAEPVFTYSARGGRRKNIFTDAAVAMRFVIREHSLPLFIQFSDFIIHSLGNVFVSPLSFVAQTGLYSELQFVLQPFVSCPDARYIDDRVIAANDMAKTVSTRQIIARQKCNHSWFGTVLVLPFSRFLVDEKTSTYLRNAVNRVIMNYHWILWRDVVNGSNQLNMKCDDRLVCGPSVPDNSRARAHACARSASVRRFQCSWSREQTDLWYLANISTETDGRAHELRAIRI